MRLRPPSVPLIAVDPFFSVWSATETLTGKTTVHWTDKPNTLQGTICIDGEEFRFLGDGAAPALAQVKWDISALVTDYMFTHEKITLEVSFFTPVFMDNLYYLSRPVSYLRLKYESVDGHAHDVSVKIAASEELCINLKGETPVCTEALTLPNGGNSIRIGSIKQDVLWRSGDSMRIDWGYFYLAGNTDCFAESYQAENMTFISLSCTLSADQDTYLTFAYDDIHSLCYFGKPVDAYWKTKGITIEEAITEALNESGAILKKCREFSQELYQKAATAGGEQYAEILSLAYRQVVAAHKLAVDTEGSLLYISKECTSNGCSATVDVTYPASPMLLYYNPDLLKAALRPIFKYALSADWPFDFAPHDIGTYPLLNGPAYGIRDGKHIIEGQMPVEESGNVLIMLANIALMDGNAEFAAPYMPLLKKWVAYLTKYGEDPGNQLCTDDFTGLLEHNCNLSVKAIMGIAGYSKLLELLGQNEEAYRYLQAAKCMANSWSHRAANGDGSYRLAFDQPNTFSLKYNIVWDKLWKTELFGEEVLLSEFRSYQKHMNTYGVPLDSRGTHSKTDWLMWAATLAPTKEEFAEFAHCLWKAFSTTGHRLPMMDWYDTVSALNKGCFHRPVQGGLFIKLLETKL